MGKWLAAAFAGRDANSLMHCGFSVCVLYVTCVTDNELEYLHPGYSITIDPTFTSCGIKLGSFAHAQTAFL